MKKKTDSDRYQFKYKNNYYFFYPIELFTPQIYIILLHQ